MRTMKNYPLFFILTFLLACSDNSTNTNKLSFDNNPENYDTKVTVYSYMGSTAFKIQEIYFDGILTPEPCTRRFYTIYGRDYKKFENLIYFDVSWTFQYYAMMGMPKMAKVFNNDSSLKSTILYTYDNSGYLSSIKTIKATSLSDTNFIIFSHKNGKLQEIDYNFPGFTGKNSYTYYANGYVSWEYVPSQIDYYNYHFYQNSSGYLTGYDAIEILTGKISVKKRFEYNSSARICRETILNIDDSVMNRTDYVFENNLVKQFYNSYDTTNKTLLYKFNYDNLNRLIEIRNSFDELFYSISYEKKK
jgi:hypothetical protein